MKRVLIEENMMKKILLGVVLVAFALGTQAVTVDFNTGTSTTGNNLDNITVSGTEVAVAEISGLNITATFGETNGVTVANLNATAARLGINSSVTGDGSSLLDPSEWMAFAFDDDVNVTRFKFTDFGDGDSVRITWDTTILTLTDTDLDSNNDYVVDWDVDESDTIRFDAISRSAEDSSGGFGFREMDVTVVPEPATIAMFGIGGLIAFIIRRSALK